MKKQSGQKTDVESLAEKGNQPEEYDRKKKIGEAADIIISNIPRIIWGLNTFPLFIILIFFSGFAVIMTMPLSLIIWFFTGDRPVRRMQPTNFFYLLFRGMTEGMEANYEEMPLNLDRESPSMRMVYQLSADLRFFSDYNYSALYNYYILGKTHPATGLKCYMHIRLLGLALYGLVTYPYLLLLMKVVGHSPEIRPELQNFSD